MLHSLKNTLRRIIPASIWNLGHLFFAWFGAWKYNHPSEKLFVIGVTGTSGKSSTVYLLRQLLESLGFTVGSLSTIDFAVNGDVQINDKKMTMLGRTKIQEYLRKMVDAGCEIAIVETTSEGRVQHRHRFINYDVMMLTNFYPEHIESHGSFEAYKQAKLDLFRYLSHLPKKKTDILRGKMKVVFEQEDFIPKQILVNNDIEQTLEFLSPDVDKKYIFGKQTWSDEEQKSALVNEQFLTNEPTMDKHGLHFTVNEQPFAAQMYATYNSMNITGVIALARMLKIEWPDMQAAVKQFCGVPGRIEMIKEAEAFGFQVIVDYAFEPVAMQALYDVVTLLEPACVIHVFGSTGGGRDVARRFSVGKLVGEQADICIVTDEDPYDDDPLEIINDVARAVAETGKNDEENLFRMLHRDEAIQKAIVLAQPGDLVLVTGKGSEQAMCVKGRLIPWDDRKEVRKALRMREQINIDD